MFRTIFGNLVYIGILSSRSSIIKNCGKWFEIDVMKLHVALDSSYLLICCQLILQLFCQSSWKANLQEIVYENSFHKKVSFWASECQGIQLNFRCGYDISFKQGVPWHSGNYRVKIHYKTRMWHVRTYSSSFLMQFRRLSFKSPTKIVCCILVAPEINWIYATSLMDVYILYILPGSASFCFWIYFSIWSLIWSRQNLIETLKLVCWKEVPLYSPGNTMERYLFQAFGIAFYLSWNNPLLVHLLHKSHTNKVSSLCDMSSLQNLQGNSSLTIN